MKNLVIILVALLAVSCHKLEDIDVPMPEDPKGTGNGDGIAVGHYKKATECGEDQIWFDGEKFYYAYTDPDTGEDTVHVEEKWGWKKDKKKLKSDVISAEGCVDTCDLENFDLITDDIVGVEIDSLKLLVDTTVLPCWTTDEIKYQQNKEFNVYDLIANYNDMVSITVDGEEQSVDITLPYAADLIIAESDFEMVDSLFEEEQCDTVILTLYVPEDPRKGKQELRVITKKFSTPTFETFYNIGSIEGLTGKCDYNTKNPSISYSMLSDGEKMYTYKIMNNGSITVYDNGKKVRDAAVSIMFKDSKEYVALDLDELYYFEK